MVIAVNDSQATRHVYGRMLSIPLCFRGTEVRACAIHVHEHAGFVYSQYGRGVNRGDLGLSISPYLMTLTLDNAG